MEIEELRFGNYYKWYSEGNYYIYKVQVKDFFDDNYRNFEPIELTEEWLFDFGFIKLDKYSYVLNGWFIHFRVKKDSFIYNKRTKIKYVHQLQDLYYSLSGNRLYKIC